MSADRRSTTSAASGPSSELGNLRASLIGRVTIRDARRGLKHLDDGPKGDPFAVRQASPPHNRRSPFRSRGRNSRISRVLPISGRAHHRYDLAYSRLDRPFEHVSDCGDFFVATDQRGLETTGSEGCGCATSTRFHAATGSDFPFTRSGSMGKVVATSRTSRYVASPIRISPGAAASSSRAATLTASPTVKRFGSPAITSPVVTPVRMTIPISHAPRTHRSAYEAHDALQPQLGPRAPRRPRGGVGCRTPP